jgi:hypothetical protein
MPQWRKLHCKIVESVDLDEMPDDLTRLLWVLLPTQLCSQGRGQDNPAWIRSRVFPLRTDVTIEMIDDAMGCFAQLGMILRYQVAGRRYFQLVNWLKYQGNTSRESESDYPPPPAHEELQSSSQDAGKQLASDSRTTHCEASCESIPREAAGREQSDRDELLTTDSGATREQVVSNSGTDVDADAEKISGANAPAPAAPQKSTVPAGKNPVTAAPKRAKPRPGNSKTAKSPPAVRAFRRAAHRYPPKSWYGDIDAAVGCQESDVEFWEKLVKGWVGRGWNPTNVAGMLECYKRREMPGARGVRASPQPLSALEDYERWVSEQEPEHGKPK